jgi:recombination protein RecR
LLISNMKNPSKYLEMLIREFSRLPGIGPKSASRLAFHILKMPPEDVESLSRAIVVLKQNISTCTICGGISDGDICSICSDSERDRGLLCVVQEQRDVLSIEKSGEFTGLYHVLGGVISPLDGIGPEELNIKSLIERCRDGIVKEIIIATNPTVEGDATSLYLSRELKSLGVTVMRIAHGLPIGADIEFADSATIAQSLRDRIKI